MHMFCGMLAVFTKANSRYRCFNGLKFSADFGWRIRLGIEHIVLWITARQKENDAILGSTKTWPMFFLLCRSRRVGIEV